MIAYPHKDYCNEMGIKINKGLGLRHVYYDENRSRKIVSTQQFPGLSNTRIAFVTFKIRNHCDASNIFLAEENKVQRFQFACKDLIRQADDS